MLVTAKIRPVGEWCGPARMTDVYDKFRLLVGLRVQFDTDSLVSAGLCDRPCDGRMWRLTEQSRDAAARLLGRPQVASYVCEHQLELGD
jgi:hypothetical protein